LADTHADCTHEEQIATPKLFDHIQAWESRGDVDAIGNDLDDERVLETGSLEVLRSVIDCQLLVAPQDRGGSIHTDKVHTGQLLQSLKQTPRHKTLAQSAPEAFNIRRLPE
jgi:hypothetical protein